jgi:hypothetical protein
MIMSRDEERERRESKEEVGVESGGSRRNFKVLDLEALVVSSLFWATRRSGGRSALCPLASQMQHTLH